MLEVALLIFAIAFTVMVGVFIPIGVKLYKTVDVVNAVSYTHLTLPTN